MAKLKDILTDLRDRSMKLERPKIWATVSLPRGLRVHYNYTAGLLLLERNDVIPSEQEMLTVIKHFPVVLHPDPDHEVAPDNDEWVTEWNDPNTDSFYRMAEVKEVLDES